MEANNFFLKLYSLIGLHKGEERKVLSFLGLQFAISIIIGLLSTGIDPIFLGHELDPYELKFVSAFELAFEMKNVASPISQLSAALLGISSALMFIAGLWYASFTDRVDKRRIGFIGMVVLVLICLAFGVLLIAKRFGAAIPFLYSFLYMFRFLAGIFLLITFWDFVNLFFSPRESRRLFPLVASGGAVGYSLGCLLVIPIEIALPSEWLLFSAAILGILVFLSFWGLQKRFLIVAEPRFRNVSGFKEIKDGAGFFIKNPFLRILGISAFVFGLLSGLIMFSYNSIVSELKTQNATVSIMALQRAGATILQAFVLTRLMSQTSLGKRFKEGIILQGIALLIGFFIYVISMVGVADFTRQVEIALMSPAFMSSLMIIPIRYRGRSMAINNLVIAPMGMAIASVFVYIFKTKAPLSVFIYLLAFLLILRLVLNFFVSKQYIRYIRDSFFNKKKLPLENLYEQDLFKDKKLLSCLLDSAGTEETALKAMIWGKLSEKVTTIEDFQYLCAWKPEETDVMYASWIYAAARLDFQSYKDAIYKSQNSNIREIRLAAKEIRIKFDYAQKEITRKRAFSEIKKNFNSVPDEIELLFRINDNDFFSRLSRDWDTINNKSKNQIFALFEKYPAGIDKEFFEKLLLERTENIKILKSFVKVHNLGIKDYQRIYSKLTRVRAKLDLLKSAFERNDEEINRWLSSEFTGCLNRLTSADQHGWHSSMKRHIAWSDSEYKILITLCEQAMNRDIFNTAQNAGLIELARKEIIKTICCIYLAWVDSGEIKDSRYSSLIDKWFEADLNELLRVLLLISAFGLKTAGQRAVVSAIARGIGGGQLIDIKRQHDEIISLVHPDVRQVFLSLTDDLAKEEKALILKKFVRGFYITFKELINVWSKTNISAASQVKSELISFYSVEKNYL